MHIKHIVKEQTVILSMAVREHQRRKATLAEIGPHLTLKTLNIILGPKLQVSGKQCAEVFCEEAMCVG